MWYSQGDLVFIGNRHVTANDNVFLRFVISCSKKNSFYNHSNSVSRVYITLALHNDSKIFTGREIL